MDEKLLQRKFEEKKRMFNHVPLKNCRFSTKIPTAAISMETFDIVINPEFIRNITDSKHITIEEALGAVLEHEIGHFAYHPFSVERTIAESIKSKSFKQGELVRNFYDDVNDNLRLLVKNPDSRIPFLYIASNPEINLEKVLSRFCELQTERDFGIGELSEDLEGYVSRLEKINFLNKTPKGRIEFVKSSERKNLEDLANFHAILKPLFEEHKEQKEKHEKEGQSYTPTSPSPDDFGEKDLRKGLKKLIQEGVINKEEIKEFIQEHGHKFESGSLPGGAYNNDPETFADRFFYESLAQKQKIRIKKTHLISSNGAYPTSLDKFNFSDSLVDFDPFSSMGTKIIPGVSNKWVRETISSYGQLEKTPDLCLLLDDSGSMPDPRKQISNAVISSLVIAREYTKNNSLVQVTLFSDRTKSFDSSKDYNKIASHLLNYKNGSDTLISLEEVPRKEGADYVLITDGQIGNRGDVVGFLNEHANRAYFITIGNYAEPSVEGRIKYLFVSDAGDISKIVLDDIHKGAK